MSTTTLVSFRDFEQLPGRPGKQELIHGEVITTPPPRKNHTLTAEAFVAALRNGLEASRVHMEAGYKIGENWLQPDVSVCWPDQAEESGYFAGAPMLAVEILSEHKSAQQVEDKLDLYFSNGAREVWTVSRRTKTMTAHVQPAPGRRVSTRVMDEYKPDWVTVTIRAAELIVT